MRWMRSRWIPADDETPFGINLAAGALALVAGDFLAGRVPATDGLVRGAMVAISLGVFAVLTVDWRAVAALVVPAWMVLNGFLVNTLGDLSWHGRADLYRLAALVAAGALGLLAGRLRDRLLDLRDRDQLGAQVHSMATDFDRSAEINKETRRRA